MLDDLAVRAGRLVTHAGQHAPDRWEAAEPVNLPPVARGRVVAHGADRERAEVAIGVTLRTVRIPGLVAAEPQLERLGATAPGRGVVHPVGEGREPLVRPERGEALPREHVGDLVRAEADAVANEPLAKGTDDGIDELPRG